MSSLSRLLGCLWLVMAMTGAVSAHDPGLSFVEIVADAGTLDARVTLAKRDVESLAPGLAPEDLKALAGHALEVESDGRGLEPVRTSARLAEGDAVSLLLRYEARPGPLTLRAPLLARLPRGHRQYVAVRNAGDGIVAQRLLRAGDDTLRFDLQAHASLAGSLGRFLALGIEHILTGYDHLAFLLALLIVGGSFRSILKIVTSFSIAHSITLALAATDVVRLSPRIVEPLIAASIVYVGLENLLRRDFRHRALLTFGFGLVHGLGFATALRESGIGTAGVGLALPLASFNVGVELGQLAVVALVLPLVTRLARNEAFAPRYVPACSTLLALAGAGWLLVRVFGS